MIDILEVCKKAAKAGGDAVVNYKPTKFMHKADKYKPGHALVTPADFMSQEAVLKEVKNDIGAYVITEEYIDNPDLKGRLILSGNLEKMIGSRVYIIDELDGTSGFAIGHYEWAVSVGCVENLEHVAGAIFAPKIDGGTLFYASKGDGAYALSRGRKEKLQVLTRDKMEEAYVIFGVDNFLKRYPEHNKLLTEVGNSVRTVNSNGSCAIAMGIVAAGRADVLIQPLHSCWDWAAGKVLIEEAGGKMVFYEMENGEINVVDTLEPKHYDPSKKVVGFVAGNPNIVDNIIGMLVGE